MILAIISQQLAYYFTFIKSEEGAPLISGAFYQFNALTHCILWLGYVYTKNKSSWSNRIICYGIILSANQFIDEISRRAMETQVNEVTLGILIIIHIAYSFGNDYGRKLRS